jgi:hypothetical protein
MSRKSLSDRLSCYQASQNRKISSIIWIAESENTKIHPTKKKPFQKLHFDVAIFLKILLDFGM